MSTTLSKPPTAACVEFIGPESAIRTNPEVVDRILAHYGHDPDAHVHVFVSPRLEHTALEWTLRRSSPRGIATYTVTQRVPHGIVSFIKE